MKKTVTKDTPSCEHYKFFHPYDRNGVTCGSCKYFGDTPIDGSDIMDIDSEMHKWVGRTAEKFNNHDVTEVCTYGEGKVVRFPSGKFRV